MLYGGETLEFSSTDSIVSSIKNKGIVTPIIMGIVFLILIATASAQITLSSDIYSLNEPVKIELENAKDHTIIIESKATHEIYTYLDATSKMVFRPKVSGQYVVSLYDKNDLNNLVSQRSFFVSDGSKKVKAYTAEKKYVLGEKVEIYLQHMNGYQIFVSSQQETYQFQGKLGNTISFIPKHLGTHSIEVKDASQKIVYATSFQIVSQNDYDEQTTEPDSNFNTDSNNPSQPGSNDNNNNNDNNSENNLNKKNSNNPNQNPFSTEQDNQNNQIKIDPSSKNDVSLDLAIERKEQQLQAELFKKYYNTAKVHRVDKEKIRIRTKSNKRIEHKITLQSKVNNDTFEAGDDLFEGVYDAQIKINESPVTQVQIFDLRYDGYLDLEIEEIKKDLSIKNKRSIKTISVVADQVDFTTGYVSSIAKGRELWKCSSWNANSQTCQGSWKKIKSLSPGQEYDIILDSRNIAFAEIGAATVNALKPIYRPGETADLVMIVLDIAGYPAYEANVTLTVQHPNDEITVLSTEQNTIVKKDKGLFVAQFNKTQQEGVYDLFVDARGPHVNYQLASNFSVQQEYMFDIQRDVPHVMDPFSEPFTSNIKVVPQVPGIEVFNVTEILPSNFEIIDTGNAIGVMTLNDTIELKWEGVTPDTLISYTVQPPKKAPDVYALGGLKVEYQSQTFYEPRQWFVAMDPYERNAIITYRNTTDTSVVLYKIWNTTSGSLGPAQQGPDVGTALFWQKIRCMREHNMCLWAGVEDDTNINFASYNITSNTWSSITILGTQGRDDTFPVDIECEDLSGDCLIVYETTTTGNDVFAYRIFSASTATLGSEQTYTSTPIDNTDVEWFNLYPKYNSDEIGLVLKSDGNAIVGVVWDGDNFGDDQLFFDPGPVGNRPTHDCAWEGSSGDLICFYASNNLEPIGAFEWDGATWNDLGDVIDATVLSGTQEQRNLDACGETPFTGDLSHDKIIFSTLDSGSDRYATFWNGTGMDFGRAPTEDGAQEQALDKTFICNWEHDGNTAILAMVDNNQLTPELVTFSSLTDTFSVGSWGGGSTTGMFTVNDDIRSLVMSLHPTTDEILLVGSSISSGGTPTSVGCSRWTGSAFSATGCGEYDDSVSTTTTGQQESSRFTTVDWFRYEDEQEPNVTIVAPADETVALTNAYNFTWQTFDNKDVQLLCELTIDGVVNQTVFSSNGGFSNYSLSEISIGEHDWNVTCYDDFDNQNTSLTFTFVVAGPPIITINDVNDDTTSIYVTSDQTPVVNASIHIDSTCYLSEINESYTDMVSNGRVNCGSYTRNVAKECEYTNSLTAGQGNDFLYMACESTFGDENDQTTLIGMELTIQCDDHADCPSSDYCNEATKACVADTLAGFTCESIGIGGVPADEICQTGISSGALCVNDSTYSYTGWYCTADADDCVYNNGGNSYDLNYILCEGGSNDYRSCGSGNEWGSLVDCGEINDGSNQTASASTHTNGYCGYFAVAQTCTSGDQDTSNYGCQGISVDCGDYIYAGSGACGSTAADCDVGCGASCDVDNSTAPQIIGNTCYYDRSCGSSCTFSESTEEAPEFCINDFDGGPCAYNNRTNATVQEICYFNAECIDSIGANLSMSGILRQDYCDFCNASGNFTGQFAPVPNTSCTSNCPNTGTIYYDTGETPLIRGDDCLDGISTILSDTLAIGDIYNGSAQAICEDTECNLDCGTLIGTCNAGVCECEDNDNPMLLILGPQNNSWDNDASVDFTYNVTDLSVGLENCSLVVNSVINLTNITIEEDHPLQSFTQTFVNGTYDWYIQCFDNSTNHNVNISGTRTIGIDTSFPSISDANREGTQFDVNDVVCLNVTASDTFSDISSVLAEIVRPGLGVTNVSLSDSTTTVCDQANGNNVYSLEYILEFSGEYNWSNAYAIDNANNAQPLAVSLPWNVSEGGTLNLSMYTPATAIEINESDQYVNYSYTQNCTITCASPQIDCVNVSLFTLYDPDGTFTEINSTTTDLVNLEDFYSCGNLTSLGRKVSLNIKAESHGQLLTTVSDTATLDQSYNRSKAFIVTQTQLNDSDNRDMTSKHATVEFTNCNNDICDQVLITRYGTVYDAFTGYNIIQSDAIDVYEFNVTWGVSETSDTVDISGWAPKPSTLAELQSQCFIQGAGNFRLDSADTDCNAASKVHYTFTDANTVTGDRGWGEDCTDQDGVSHGYVVCFNDDSKVYNITQTGVDIETSISNYNIGATIDQTRSFITCNWHIIDGAGGGDADGIEANNLYYEISSASQIGVARSQIGTTEATIDFTCHVIEFDAQLSFNGVVDQDILDRTAGGEIGDMTRVVHNLSSPIDLNATIPICSFGFDSGEGVAHERGEWAFFFNDSDTIRLRRGRTGNSDPSSSIACQAITFPNETIVFGEVNASNTCSHVFTIHSGQDSGNNTWEVECEATSENSATVFSLAENVTVNDHPNASFFSPENGTWITGNAILNASSSFDTDGSLVNYRFYIDDNTAFSSPTVLCDSSEHNCTFDTTAQAQCLEDTFNCFFRVNITDDDGLTHVSTISLGIDNSGPIVVLGNPLNFSNISQVLQSLYTVNATVTDTGSGVDTVTFEYRENDSATWSFACSDTTEPYACVWNTTNITQGNFFEFRVYANDTLGQQGNIDTHYNITMDKTGPQSNLSLPLNETYFDGSLITFYYTVNDTYLPIDNCSLVLNGIINLTNYSVSETAINNFTVTNIAENNYTWHVLCYDTIGNQNTSDDFIFYIDQTGPVSVLDRPPQAGQIEGSSYTINATITDAGIGANTTTFEYRPDTDSSWTTLCSDTTLENNVASCVWDTTIINEGTTYQVRVYANDSFNNIGTADNHTSITIDNFGPKITPLLPSNTTVDGDGNVQFRFIVNDTISDIANCSLILNATINQTIDSNIGKGVVHSFNVSNMSNGDYFWNITCWDDYVVQHENITGTYTLSIDIRFDMNVTVTTTMPQYEVGNQIYQNGNITTNVTDVFGNALSDAAVDNDLVYLTNITELVVPWWNTSWERRKAIYIASNSSHERFDVTVEVNVSGLVGYLDNCPDEIRVVDINQTVIQSNIIGGDNISSCMVAFIANVGGSVNNQNHYFVYYNNSDAPNPGFAIIESNTYDIFFEGFETGTWSTITTEDPGQGCSSGYGDNFNNCDGDTTVTDDYDFARTSGATTIDGTYVLVMDDWDVWEADGGIWYNFNPEISCASESCDDIRVLGHVATGSIENDGEYCRVWARNDSSTNYATIFNCQGAAPSCEFDGGANSMPTDVSDYERINLTLLQAGLSLTDNVSVHVGGQLPQGGDQCFYDNMNITGIKLEAPNITSHVGFEQLFVQRTQNITTIDGLTHYLLRTQNNTFGNYSAVSLATKNLYTDNYNDVLFEILPDNTGPNVTLNSPLNNTGSNSSVTFTYLVEDVLSTVSNCSLYIDNVFESEDTLIEEGFVQFFFPRIPSGGPHLWNVSCTDYYNNTATSETWIIIITPPDLFVNISTFTFNNSDPQENENITLSAVVRNIGGSDALNVTAQFFIGNILDEVQIGENITFNISDISQNDSETRLNMSWVVTGPGPHLFHLVVDPAFGSNGSISEANETNNDGNATLNVTAYHLYYGNATDQIVLTTDQNESKFTWNISSGGNVYIVETGSDIDWFNLQALTRDTLNVLQFNDLADADGALNMTTFRDSLNNTYATNGVIDNTASFTIYQTLIENVPIVNSSQTDVFTTGILWDTSDLARTDYNGTQDIVFITGIDRGQTGEYGIYDYEIKIPATFDNYKLGANSVSLYTEII